MSASSTNIINLFRDLSPSLREAVRSGEMTHDDSVELTQALGLAYEALVAAGGGSLYLPAGTYKFVGSEFSAISILHNDVRIVGAGRAATLITALSGAACEAIVSIAAGTSGVSMLDVGLVGDGSDMDAIHVSGGAHALRLSRLGISGVRDGFVMSAGEYRDCRIENVIASVGRTAVSWRILQNDSSLDNRIDSFSVDSYNGVAMDVDAGVSGRNISIAGDGPCAMRIAPCSDAPGGDAISNPSFFEKLSAKTQMDGATGIEVLAPRTRLVDPSLLGHDCGILISASDVLVLGADVSGGACAMRVAPPLGGEASRASVVGGRLRGQASVDIAASFGSGLARDVSFLGVAVSDGVHVGSGAVNARFVGCALPDDIADEGEDTIIDSRAAEAVVVGEDAPDEPSEGGLWFDPSDNAMRVFTSTPTQASAARRASVFNQEGWSSPQNAVDGAAGGDEGTFASFASSAANVVNTAFLEGFSFSAHIPDDAQVVSVEIRVRQYVSHTARTLAPTVRAFIGAEALGAGAQVLSHTNDASNIDVVELPGITAADLRHPEFRIRFVAGKSSSTLMGTQFLDYIDVFVSYTYTQTSWLRFISERPDGSVTTPDQPAFHAHGSPVGNITLNAGDVVPFEVVRFNRGGHYNPATSRFTAPVDGIYLVWFTAFNNSATAGKRIRITVNNNYVFGQGSSVNLVDFHQSASIFLHANDFVEVRNLSDSTIIHKADQHNEFGCVLLG